MGTVGLADEKAADLCYCRFATPPSTLGAPASYRKLNFFILSEGIPRDPQQPPAASGCRSSCQRPQTAGCARCLRAKARRRHVQVHRRHRRSRIRREMQSRLAGVIRDESPGSCPLGMGVTQLRRCIRPVVRGQRRGRRTRLPPRIPLNLRL